MSYIVVFAVALMITLPGCGVGEPPCVAVEGAYDRCYAVGGGTIEATCEAEFFYGVCERVLYWACYTDNECSDTNDTDTIAKIEACLDTNKSKCD